MGETIAPGMVNSILISTARRDHRHISHRFPERREVMRWLIRSLINLAVWQRGRLEIVFNLASFLNLHQN
jgi:hypothetical protein